MRSKIVISTFNFLANQLRISIAISEFILKSRNNLSIYISFLVVDINLASLFIIRSIINTIALSKNVINVKDVVISIIFYDVMILESLLSI